MQYFERLFLIVFLCFFLVQCSGDSTPEQPESVRVLDEIPQHIQEVENLSIFPGDSEPLYSLELIEEQAFGKSGEPFLSTIHGCVVDDKDRVIILNSGSDYQQILYVFNADGTYNTQLGRQGKGPGEYGTVVGMYAKAGKIFVLDYTSQRLNEYSTMDYSFIRSILFEQWSSSNEFRFGYVEGRNDGNYLITFSDGRSKLGRLEIKFEVMNSEGKRTDFEPLVFPDGFRIKAGQSMQPTMPLTFQGQTITSLSDEDVLHTAWTRDFLIKKYDAKGIYQSAVYYPIQGLPFDLNEYTKTEVFSPKVRDIEEAFTTMDEKLPEIFPVIKKLMVDDENRIWVAVPLGTKGDNYEWWVLKESGELLTKLRLSSEEKLFQVKNGYLYSKETNEETGSDFVIKYYLEWTKNKL